MKVRLLSTVTVLSVMAVAFAAPTASAEAPAAPLPGVVLPSQAARLGAGWLAGQVSAAGAIANPASGLPDVALTISAVIGFDAAGVARGKATKAIAWLQTQVPLWVAPGGADNPGRLALAVMAATAMGQDPRSFYGSDLVARIVATQQGSGADAGLFGTDDPTFDGTYRESLALLALSAAGVTNALGVTWLRNQQCASGGWTGYRASLATPCPAPDPVTYTGPDTNSSALAVQALKAQGGAVKHPVAPYFDAAQSADGGWAFIGGPGQASDANSTALVVQALVSIGSLNAARFRTAAGATPMSALLSFQLDCTADPADRGSFGFQPFGGSLFPDLYATVQAIPAAAKLAFPVPAQALSGVVPTYTCLG